MVTLVETPINNHSETILLIQTKTLVLFSLQIKVIHVNLSALVDHISQPTKTDSMEQYHSTIKATKRLFIPR